MSRTQTSTLDTNVHGEFTYDSICETPSELPHRSDNDSGYATTTYVTRGEFHTATPHAEYLQQTTPDRKFHDDLRLNVSLTTDLASAKNIKDNTNKSFNRSPKKLNLMKDMKPDYEDKDTSKPYLENVWVNTDSVDKLNEEDYPNAGEDQSLLTEEYEESSSALTLPLSPDEDIQIITQSDCSTTSLESLNAMTDTSHRGMTIPVPPPLPLGSAISPRWSSEKSLVVMRSRVQPQDDTHAVLINAIQRRRQLLENTDMTRAAEDIENLVKKSNRVSQTIYRSDLSFLITSLPARRSASVKFEEKGKSLVGVSDVNNARSIGAETTKPDHPHLRALNRSGTSYNESRPTAVRITPPGSATLRYTVSQTAPGLAAESEGRKHYNGRRNGAVSQVGNVGAQLSRKISLKGSEAVANSLSNGMGAHFNKGRVPNVRLTNRSTSNSRSAYDQARAVWAPALRLSSPVFPASQFCPSLSSLTVGSLATGQVNTVTFGEKPLSSFVSDSDHVNGDAKTNMLKHWSVEQVGDWLNSLDYGMYRQKFAEKKITGERLIELRSIDLVALGVTQVLHQVKLEMEVRRLKRNDGL